MKKSILILLALIVFVNIQGVQRKRGLGLVGSFLTGSGFSYSYTFSEKSKITFTNFMYLKKKENDRDGYADFGVKWSSSIVSYKVSSVYYFLGTSLIIDDRGDEFEKKHRLSTGLGIQAHLSDWCNFYGDIGYRYLKSSTNPKDYELALYPGFGVEFLF